MTEQPDEYGFTNVHMPHAEALKAFKTLARGRTVYLHVAQRAQVIHSERPFSHDVTGTAQVTKAVALRFIREAYRPYADRVHVELSYSEKCLFVG